MSLQNRNRFLQIPREETLKIKSIEQAEKIYSDLNEFYKTFIQSKIEKHGYSVISRKCKINKSQFHKAINSKSIESKKRISIIIEEANKTQGENNDDQFRFPLGRPRNDHKTT